MKFNLPKGCCISLKLDDQIIAVIQNPTVELLKKAISEHHAIDEADISSMTLPSEYDGNGDRGMAVAFMGGEYLSQFDYYLSCHTLYGTPKTISIDDVIESLGDKEFDDPITDEHLDYLRDNFTSK